MWLISSPIRQFLLQKNKTNTCSDLIFCHVLLLSFHFSLGLLGRKASSSLCLGIWQDCFYSSSLTADGGKLFADLTGQTALRHLSCFKRERANSICCNGLKSPWGRRSVDQDRFSAYSLNIMLILWDQQFNDTHHGWIKKLMLCIKFKQELWWWILELH